MKNKCILYFHQGWTDIINCLGIITYYSNMYNITYLIMRKDAKPIIDYYTRDKNNVKLLYEDKNSILYIRHNVFQYVINNYPDLDLHDADILGIGQHDKYRNDKYKNKNAIMSRNSKEKNFFVNLFYDCYDIPYINRIDGFKITRDKKLENKVYNDFINKYGEDYILFHEIIKNNDNKCKNIINLNGITDNMFEYIKVLEHAKEIHLLDSVWGALIYLLDAKYKLFQDKKIVLYAKRSYTRMFTEPYILSNWIILN
uniref:Uncharacterized protein n=1 Tax=Florenciella sp. virus SA2 TaxID=3240092 RepID=A0AB39J9S6_9VIRU